MYAEEVLVVKADVDEKRQRIAELEMQVSSLHSSKRLSQPQRAGRRCL